MKYEKTFSCFCKNYIFKIMGNCLSMDGCCRPFIDRATEWPVLARNMDISDEDIASRVYSYWTVVSSLAGLLAGFTYIIANTEITFTGDDADKRSEIFGGIVIITFFSAVFATLFSAMQYAMLNLVGTKNVRWYIRNFWMVIDQPFAALAVTVVLMLISTIVAIGGLYDNLVFVISVVYGGNVGLAIMVMFFFFKFKVNYRLREDANSKNVELQLGTQNDANKTD